MRKRFGDPVAVDDLGSAVPGGQMFGFVGRNGAGKTTTMRIICGLLRVEAGTVLWDGRPVDARQRERIGYMPEERGRYPKMRVGDQLELTEVRTRGQETDARVDLDVLARIEVDRTGTKTPFINACVS